MICSSLYLLVLMSIILEVDGLLGKMTDTVYEGAGHRHQQDREAHQGETAGLAQEPNLDPGMLFTL